MDGERESGSGETKEGEITLGDERDMEGEMGQSGNILPRRGEMGR